MIPWSDEISKLLFSPIMLTLWPLVTLLFVVGIVIACTAIILRYLVTTNDPYAHRNSIILPFTTTVRLEPDGEIELQKIYQPQLETGPMSRVFAWVRTGVRIPWYSLWRSEKPLPGTEDEIIAAIHKKRFDPKKPYVITGSHYSDLYMRNMGVFFNALLDPRLPTNHDDWQNRQRIALQTIAYDLSFLRANQGQAVTTIVPQPGGKFTGLNIYRPPSDSLWSVMYSLQALSDPTFMAARFPTVSGSAHLVTQKLQTTTAAAELLHSNREILSTTLNHYLETVIDPQTHLIRSDIHLSSARDGIKRESSFYDNVIAWATVQSANELEIPHQQTLDSSDWRQKIIETFWNEEVGIFRNDLATEEVIFSADSLIVTSAGFFDLTQESHRSKLNRMITYIRTQKLDQPFPLRYSLSNQSNNMHLAVKYFAPSYMGDGIWSHWGMEYIKALAGLSGAENDYAVLAQHHLAAYQKNIETFGGYPELYDSNGTAFRSSLVHGVLHTGWVVNYEQAKMMVGGEG